MGYEAPLPDGGGGFALGIDPKLSFSPAKGGADCSLINSKIDKTEIIRVFAQSLKFIG